MSKKRTDAHGRKLPRRPRWNPNADPMRLARSNASALTPGEIERQMAPQRAAFTVLRRGQAGAPHMRILLTLYYLAHGLERHGNLAGGSDLLKEFWRVHEAIDQRSEGRPHLAPLRAAEMETIALTLDLYRMQLEHCTYGEYCAARRAALAMCRRDGGVVIDSHAGDALVQRVLAEAAEKPPERRAP